MIMEVEGRRSSETRDSLGTARRAAQRQLDGRVVFMSSTSHSSPTFSMVTVTWFL